MKLRSQYCSGFTLIEIMVVVLLIGVLAAMAIPNFKKAIETTHARACIVNLKNIDGAKLQWMMAANKTSADTPPCEELFGEDKFIEDEPKCPAGGTYELRTAGKKTLCSIPGHKR
jgi:prepilin-type N-terminal cleavage/methylation domain-containing protein